MLRKRRHCFIKGNFLYLLTISLFSFSVFSYDRSKLEASIAARVAELHNFRNELNYARLAANNKIAIQKLVKDRLYFHHKEDYNFIAEKLELYGLSNFKINGSEILLFKDSRDDARKSTKVNFSLIIDGILIINGQLYDYDLSKNLQWNFENKALKEIKNSAFLKPNFFNKFLSIIPEAQAQSCTQEQIISRTVVGASVLGLVGYCVNAAGMLIAVGSATCIGIYEYCQSGDAIASGKAFCQNLPVVKEIRAIKNPGADYEHLKF